eukprot:jgi/Mesvir1/20685/Mv14894-RA.1
MIATHRPNCPHLHGWILRGDFRQQQSRGSGRHRQSISLPRVSRDWICCNVIRVGRSLVSANRRCCRCDRHQRAVYVEGTLLTNNCPNVTTSAPVVANSCNLLTMALRRVFAGVAFVPMRMGAERRLFSSTASVFASRFDKVEMAPADPILGVTEAFKRDTDPRKLNLGVGAYRTEELQPYVLKSVREAEKRLVERAEFKEYLTIEGLETFRKYTGELLLGASNPILKEGRLATIQSLSGTGSLRIAAAFINRFMPGTAIYISNPTWGNHKNIFHDAGVQWKEYTYYDPKTVGLDFEGMKADIKAAPNGSAILLHGCAHNPTGIDPTKEQWGELADLIQSKGHFPFFDVAYQGFATGSLDEDAYAPQMFAARGMELFVCQSYSKNLGLYGERVGALNVVCNDAEGAKRVLSQLKRLARAIYSNPPTWGAKLAAEVIGDPKLFALWKEEMQMMAGRILSVRHQLYDALVKKDTTGRDWSHVKRQIGMFSFTGLNPAQVENMTAKHHVYLTKDGRISLAGLSSAKCDYLAEAIAESVKNVK